MPGDAAAAAQEAAGHATEAVAASQKAAEAAEKAAQVRRSLGMLGSSCEATSDGARPSI